MQASLSSSVGKGLKPEKPHKADDGGEDKDVENVDSDVKNVDSDNAM